LNTHRSVPLVLVATAALALGGCNGDEETTTGARTETNGTETSRNPGPPPSREEIAEAQPDRPCRPVPAATLEQIERGLKKRGDVTLAQAVRARGSFRGGLRRAYFLSALVERTDGNLDVATWVVEGLDGKGTLIPIEGLAQQVSRRTVRTPGKKYGVSQRDREFGLSRRCVAALRQAAASEQKREEK
jgi:hypothetical protein